MPRLAETDTQRIDREWYALCRYRMNMKRMNSIESLAKRMKCSMPTATKRIRHLTELKISDFMALCAILQIDIKDVADIINH